MTSKMGKEGNPEQFDWAEIALYLVTGILILMLVLMFAGVTISVAPVLQASAEIFRGFWSGLVRILGWIFGAILE